MADAQKALVLAVQGAFLGDSRPLWDGRRTLVHQGILIKICRKESKPRMFFLFTDMLVYGTPVTRGTFVQQRVLALDTVQIVDDEMTNSFKVLSPGKSFTVFSAIGEEDKALWIALLVKYGASMHDAPDGPVAALWKPDHLTSVCLVCNTSRFTTFNRRHHCRNCGTICCAPCSAFRKVLPHVSKSPVRVCVNCFKTDKRAPAAGSAPAPPPGSVARTQRGSMQRTRVRRSSEDASAFGFDDTPTSPVPETPPPVPAHDDHEQQQQPAAKGRSRRLQFKRPDETAPSQSSEPEPEPEAVPQSSTEQPEQPTSPPVGRRRRLQFVKPTPEPQPETAAPDPQPETAATEPAVPTASRSRRNRFATAHVTVETEPAPEPSAAEAIDVSAVAPSQLVLDLVETAVTARENADELAAKPRVVSILGDGGSDDDDNDDDGNESNGDDGDGDGDDDDDGAGDDGKAAGGQTDAPVQVVPVQQPPATTVRPPVPSKPAFVPAPAPVPSKPAFVPAPVPQPKPQPAVVPAPAPQPKQQPQPATAPAVRTPAVATAVDGGKKLTGPSALLHWCQTRAEPYGVPINDFSKSWADGLALAALVLSYSPSSYTFDKIRAMPPKQRLTTAIVAAEKLGAAPMMDAEDFLGPGAPDKFCVMTTVSSYYHVFKRL